jgi:hypothetical protein
MDGEWLPDDVARCAGVSQGRNWMEPCETCARRLAPAKDHGRVVIMAPPLIVFDKCEAYLPAAVKEVS